MQLFIRTIGNNVCDLNICISDNTDYITKQIINEIINNLEPNITFSIILDNQIFNYLIDNTIKINNYIDNKYKLSNNKLDNDTLYIIKKSYNDIDNRSLTNYKLFLENIITLRYASNSELTNFILKYDNDKNAMLMFIKDHGDWLENIQKYSDDEDVILAAVNNCGHSLRYTNEKHTRNRNIVLAAVTNDGYALQYVDDQFKKDREIVLAAVCNSPCGLEYAHDNLKNDKEIVLAAVKQNKNALKFANNNLKNDKEIV